MSLDGKSLLVREEAINDALDVIQKWTRFAYVNLMCGELTAQERRTVSAIIKAMLYQVTCLKKDFNV